MDKISDALPMTPVITVDKSFPIFWGISLILSWWLGGILFTTYTVLTILILFSHEYAHIQECQRLYVPIKEIRFTWLGALIDADVRHYNEAVPIRLAGVIDTGCYCVIFIELFIGLQFIGATYLLGINLANNPYLGFLGSASMLAVILSITNILPITYNHKRYGKITTDGWGAWKHSELSKELWNDGKTRALAGEQPAKKETTT